MRDMMSEDININSEIVIPKIGEKHHKNFFYFEGRNELVKAFLFDGLKTEDLDSKILHINANKTNGFYSNHYIKGHLGLYAGTKNKIGFKGIFKDKTVEEAIDILKSKNGDGSYNQLIEILEDILVSDKYKNDFNELYGRNTLFYGVPGCGKSHHIKKLLENVDEQYIERVLFHPDYTYGDFVGQILPKVEDNEVKYEFTLGPLSRIMKEAYKNLDKTYFLIIEEINRGNAPAIFGDIFQLLDRKTEEDGDDLTIGYSEYFITNKDMADKIYEGEKKEKFGDKVRIPPNLTIIASMNTSDQNVFTLDTAFQRRWNMKLIENSFENHEFKDKKIEGTNVTWQKFCETINEEIIKRNQSNISSEDKRLGTYFVSENDLENCEKFAEKVLKYLWDDAFKFSRDKIFKKEYNTLEEVVKEFKDKNSNEKFSIFLEEIKTKLTETD